MKKCKQGYYYCYTDKKCKKMPSGYHTGIRGYLVRDDENDKEKNKNGNGGNGNGSNGNGNGGNGGGNGGNGGGVSESKSGDSSLRDWFSKSRSSDGTPGWVQLGGKYAGKPCARQPGQTTKPKCGSSKMKRNLDKDEEKAAFRRKQRQDPNPDRKGKAINVKTEEVFLYNWRKELEEQLVPVTTAIPPRNYPATTYVDADKEKRVKKYIKNKGFKDIKSDYKPESEIIEGRGDGGSPYEPYKAPKEDPKNPYVPAPKRKIKPTGSQLPPIQKAHYEPENEIIEGKKDACYHKVKSRYSVWPSAYASGALVKCRKVGAANWGNKTKKEGYNESFSNWRSEFDIDEMIGTTGIRRIDSEESERRTEERKKIKLQRQKKAEERRKLLKKERMTFGIRFFDKNGSGYIDKDTGEKVYDQVNEKLNLKKADMGDVVKDFYKSDAPQFKGKTKEKRREMAVAAKLSAMEEDWQKVNKSDKTDGMSAAAVKAYRRENPGSKLKTAVTGDPKPGSKDAKRRKSFCARSKGQQDMHNIDCSKTPDKPVCKARRRWKC
jgi:hypothetical protein